MAAAEGTENAAGLSRLERVLRCESEEAHVMLSEALWDARGDEMRAAELCEAVAGDGNLERWEAEEAERRAGSRDGDRAMGGGDAIRG